MKNCPRCGCRLDSTKACPQCGFKRESSPILKIALVLIVILAVALLLTSLAVKYGFSPYKPVDESFIVLPDCDVKVQLDGVYLGITSWAGDDILYYMPPTEYDVIRVGSQYVVLTDDYSFHDLCGNEGKRVHLEGTFEDSQPTEQPFNGTIINAHFFNPDKIEIVG